MVDIWSIFGYLLSSIFIKTPVAALYLGNGGTWKYGGGSSSTDGEGPHFTQKWVPIFTKFVHVDVNLV